MDRISQLSDELLLSILSLLPSAKDVLGTMVLSKRWKSLWMFVPKLVYDYSHHNNGYGKFLKFVDRSLALHDAPVIDTLRFKLGPTCGTAGDIRMWIRDADKRCVRELTIEIDSSFRYKTGLTEVTISRSLYTCCRMLVTLKLSNAVLMDDVASPISFPFLKKLSLESMKYPGKEFIDRLLSNCPVLEDLVVKQCLDDNVTILTVKIPTLKSLSVHLDGRYLDDGGIVIDAPSLEYLDLIDNSDGFCVIENDMHNVVKARVIVSKGNIHPGVKLMSSIHSVDHLYVCFPYSKDAYPVGKLVFHRLLHLKICTCETEWLNLLMCLLRDSPNLRSLKLEQVHDDGPRLCWNEPSSIPECVISSLENLEWVKYKGTEEEKELVAFILRSGSCLKKVSISSKATKLVKKLKMLKEITKYYRRSPFCQVSFD